MEEARGKVGERMSVVEQGLWRERTRGWTPISEKVVRRRKRGEGGGVYSEALAEKKQPKHCQKSRGGRELKGMRRINRRK